MVFLLVPNKGFLRLEEKGNHTPWPKKVGLVCVCELLLAASRSPNKEVD